MAETLLFQGIPEDEAYLPHLKGLVGAAKVYVSLRPVSTVTEVSTYCKSKGITGVISTSKPLLLALLKAAGNPKSTASLDNYTGSYFYQQGIEFIFINPLINLIQVSYGKFVSKRFISKLTEPQSWYETPTFVWEILNEANETEIFTKYQTAIAIAVDIETQKEHLRITHIGFTAVFIDSSGILTTHSSVLVLNSSYALAIARKFCWQLQAAKILQNGKYDTSYLSRYNIPLYNYMWDTINLFHSWYSELPKDLAFIGAFFVRKAMYWKDLAQTNDAYEYCRYNALDTYTTALAFIAWMMQAPQWARDNYCLEFPLVFPCLLSELTGIKRDMTVLNKAREEYENKIIEDNKALSRMVGTYPAIYNVNSAPQNKQLRTILGCGDYLSSDETHLKKIGNRHPLNKRIVNKILDIRGDRKLVSTYLSEGKELNGRILYSLNPHGTDTGRLASREHAFWCGLQIQNIPRGKEVKQTLIADEGFRFAECDLKQAETRDTAYVSGDSNLIAAINSSRDFHAINAAAFFGVTYESIYDDSTGKTLNKKLRDLSKRTNHGANYLMGWSVLIDTMGEDAVWEAKRLLGLPVGWQLREVAEHLLGQFHKTYPTLQSKYYPAVVAEVMRTKMLVGATGWTRYCFGNPKDNKLDKNAYVAHVSQSLSAMVLNQAYKKVFYDIAINTKYSENFKLCAQIHDSILFQFRLGHEYLAEMVRERMEIPITVTAYDGVTRTFTVPADIKAGSDNKGAYRWSDTE